MSVDCIRFQLDYIVCCSQCSQCFQSNGIKFILATNHHHLTILLSHLIDCLIKQMQCFNVVSMFKLLIAFELWTLK